MRKEIIYEENPWDDDEPPVNLRPMANFLPSPAEIRAILKIKNINLNVKPDVLQVFEQEAEKNHVPYQEVMLRVLYEYAHSSQQQTPQI